MKKNKRKTSLDGLEDILTENDRLGGNAEVTEEQFIMGEAVEHLQGRQRDVYFLTVRQGVSLAKVAKLLDISKSAVQIYKVRAVSFVTAYCKQAIKNGRLND